MSLVQGLPYFKVPFIMPLGTATAQYSPAAPVATLGVGSYLVVFNFAIVGSTNQSSISVVLPFVFINAQGFGFGDIILDASKTTTGPVDSAASFPATPCVIYRNLTNTLNITAPNTPVYISYNNTLVGGTTQSSSFAAQDALYNYIHFIKIA